MSRDERAMVTAVKIANWKNFAEEDIHSKLDAQTWIKEKWSKKMHRRIVPESKIRVLRQQGTVLSRRAGEARSSSESHSQSAEAAAPGPA